MKSTVKNLIVATLAVCGNLALQAQERSKAIVDYRSYQSEIKNQKDRGTCTAFAIVAAMETFSGVPDDLSEQYIYADAKMTHYKEMAQYEEGAPLSFYADILKTGTVHESQCPYKPESSVWDKNAEAFEAMKADIQTSLIQMLKFKQYAYRLNQTDVILKQGMAAKDIAWIKAQLDNGVKAIPVGYAVRGWYWSQHPATENNKIKPEDFILVSTASGKVPYARARLLNPNLANDIIAGKVDAEVSEEKYIHNEGHAVTIVGYDANGFLIKNSWGKDWGESGYGWVSFDYHILFCDEAIVIPKVVFQDYAASGQTQVWEPKGFQLKVLPLKIPKGNLYSGFDGIELSLAWKGNGSPEPMADITYVVKDANGKKIEETTGFVEGIFAGLGTTLGYPGRVLNGKISPQSGPYIVEVQAKSKTGKTFTQSYRVNGAYNKCYEKS